MDLTDFVKDAGGQRWMFVSREDFSTISDVVDRLREEHQQLGQHDLVTLLLDNFTLPPWESVELLQSGDLVKVCRTKPLQDKTPTLSKSLRSTPKLAGKKPVSSSSDTSSSESEEEVVSKAKGLKVSTATRKTKSSSSSSSSDSSTAVKKIPLVPAMTNVRTAAKRKAAKSSSSSDSSDSSSDSEEPAVKTTNVPSTVRPNGKANPKDSSSDSSEDTTDTEEEKEDQTKKEAAKPIQVNVEAGQGSMLAKPRRKRKRKNKNKNKLAAEDTPVFEAEIVPTSYDLNNQRKSNAHVKFDEEMDVDENIENQQHSQEFTEADVRKLYEQSVSSRPAETSVKVVPPTSSSGGNSVKSARVDNAASTTGCEAALIKQFDEKKVSNNHVVSSSVSNGMFKPRVLSVKEMTVKTNRKEPLSFSNGVTSSSSNTPQDEDGGRQNAKEADPLSQFSALLNCAGKVFDKNDEPVKDYTAYHLVSESGPRVGDVIAFKHLDLGENYSPEVSDYKEGKVLEVDENQTVVFEMITNSKRNKNGRFEMEEIQSNEFEKHKTISWNELIEPRLIFP